MIIFLQKQTFKNRFKFKENQYRQTLRKNAIVLRNDKKQFWKFIKSLTKKSSGNSTIQSTEWFDYFSSLLNEDVLIDHEHLLCVESAMLEHDNYCVYCNNNDPLSLNENFTLDEIICYIKKLPNGKSVGVDGLCNEILKSSVSIIAPYLVNIFNTILESGDFPEAWCQSIITPLHKKGNFNDVNNYRGISLISVISKLYTGLLNQRLSKWVEVNEKLFEEQAGFRKNKNTIDHIFTLYAVISKYLCKQGGRFYCIYIDFSKAFDRVPHMLLFHKLVNTGIHGKFLTVLKSMYSKLSACINTPSGLTDFFNCFVGTRQGCMLSPLLFVIYLNTYIELCQDHNCQGVFIDEFFSNLFMLLYADDIAQVSDTVGRLQHQINILQYFCKISGMKVNENKTQIVVFRNGGPLRQNEKWYINDKEIQTVTYYKYLGLFYSSRLSWSYGVKSLSLQSQKSVNMLKCLITRCHGLPQDIIFEIFDTTIVPIICYASEIWGYKRYDVIENVQLRFCKYLLGLNTNAAGLTVLGELGWYPIFVTTYYKCVKYWLKLVQFENGSLAKSSYNMLYSLSESGKTNWVTNIKTILFKYGFGHAYLNQGVGNSVLFLQLFKERIHNCYVQEWNNELNDSSKLCLYKDFKINFVPELYLNVVDIRKYRRALSKLRCSNHKLEIEVGRHHNIPKNERFCKFCLKINLYCVEDEYHFICNCSLYNTLRIEYLQSVDLKNYYDFIQLMKTPDKDLLKRLSCYIYHAFKLRELHVNL